MSSDLSGWSAFVQSAIAAGAGLLGVAIGGFISAHNQKKERRATRIREQLEGFYSPLLGMYKEVRSKSELRTRLHDAGRKAWDKKMAGLQNPLSKAAVMESDWPRFVPQPS